MAPRYAVLDSEDDSDSNQSAAPSIPSDEALEKALRDAVAKIYQSGKMEELTVKRVRLAAERALGLEEGFFKADDVWKLKSEQVIKDEVEVQDRLAQEPAQEEDEEVEEDEQDIPSPPPKTAKPTKRTKSTITSKSRKRRKTESPEPKVADDEDTGALSDSEDEVKKPTGRQSKTRSERASAESDATKEATDAEKVDSESEMSVVLDEEPKPSRKRGKSAESTSQKGKKKASAKAQDAGLDPNEAEIKRLQGWLVKCGIRKVWSRELAPYDTPKAKIKHLKDMLKDAGMDGRYSIEKAKQIKEKREFEADLAMIKEGEKQWGRGSVEEESDSNRPRRRLNRGRQTLAFLESDGEETD